jgi:AcrR family transcriptional regulator
LQELFRLVTLPALMELRERILDAAAKLYAETGFRGATTRRIAERAGVNEITLFRHFGSKTRLLHEAIKHCGLSSNTLTLPEQPSAPRSELAEWAVAQHQEWFERRSLLRTAMGEMEERPDLLPPDRSPTRCAGEALHRYLTRLKDTRLIGDDVDVQAATMMFMGALFADAVSRDLIPAVCHKPMDQTIEQYVSLFVRAIELKESVS